MNSSAARMHAATAREVPARRPVTALPAGNALDVPLAADTVLILIWTGFVVYAFNGMVPLIVLVVSSIATGLSGVLVRRGLVALT